jgi:hypothetical protein
MLAQARDRARDRRRRAPQPERRGRRLEDAERGVVDAAKGTERAQLLALEELGQCRHRGQRDAPGLPRVEPLPSISSAFRRRPIVV